MRNRPVRRFRREVDTIINKKQLGDFIENKNAHGGWTVVNGRTLVFMKQFNDTRSVPYANPGNANSELSGELLDLFRWRDTWKFMNGEWTMTEYQCDCILERGGESRYSVPTEEILIHEFRPTRDSDYWHVVDTTLHHHRRTRPTRRR